jgi:hypothetical protein
VGARLGWGGGANGFPSTTPQLRDLGTQGLGLVVRNMYLFSSQSRRQMRSLRAVSQSNTTCVNGVCALHCSPSCALSCTGAGACTCIGTWVHHGCHACAMQCVCFMRAQVAGSGRSPWQNISPHACEPHVVRLVLDGNHACIGAQAKTDQDAGHHHQNDGNRE